MEIFTFLLLSFPVFLGQAPSGTASSLDRIRAKIKVNAVTAAPPAQLAGIYSNPPKEWIRAWGGTLGGDRLFVFPDKTYIYCEYADIHPDVIYDKGTWSFSDGVLELHSSPDITWDPHLDRKFLAVQRPSHKHEILLVGLEEQLPYFEQEAKDDPESILLVVAQKRDRTLDNKATKRWKAYLLQEEWKPEEFQTPEPTGKDNCGTVTIPDGWRNVQGLGFSLFAPAGWEYHQLPGVDSYVGEFVGDGIVLLFDLGAYSNPLNEEREPEYVVTHKLIGGFFARIVSSKIPSHGITGIYFPSLVGLNKLCISGKDLTPAEQELVLKIFGTIRFGGPEHPSAIPPPPQTRNLP